jgi:hypothetical protein
MVIHSPVLLGIGLAAMVLGLLMWRWSSRNSVNLKGAAVSAALATARSGKMPTMPGELQGHLDKVVSAGSHAERAKVVGGTVARHFMAKVVGWVGLAVLLAGAAMIAAALLWK